MPRGPKGEKRPADVIGNAVHSRESVDHTSRPPIRGHAQQAKIRTETLPGFAPDRVEKSVRKNARSRRRSGLGGILHIIERRVGKYHGSFDLPIRDRPIGLEQRGLGRG
jgi:hypothetical protein